MGKRVPGRHEQRGITLAEALRCLGDEAAAVGAVLRRGPPAKWGGFRAVRLDAGQGTPTLAINWLTAPSLCCRIRPTTELG